MHHHGAQNHRAIQEAKEARLAKLRSQQSQGGNGSGGGGGGRAEMKKGLSRGWGKFKSNVRLSSCCLSVVLVRVRLKVIRNPRIESVCTYQSCMVFDITDYLQTHPYRHFITIITINR